MPWPSSADDPALKLIRDEEIRQNSTIQLIASENFASPATMAATGSVLTNKYSEGYPGKRYYGGNMVVDQLEDLARDRICEVFGADHANVQPHAGAIATECAAARVLATDRSPDALAVARANLAGLGRAAGRVSLHEGSWFDALPMSVRGAIDVLVSNPPYIGDDEELPAVVAEWEPSEALRAGPVGDEDLQTILHGADEWVAPGGAVVLEMAPDQTAVIADRFRAAGWQSSIHGDLAGRDRAVVARKRG